MRYLSLAEALVIAEAVTGIDHVVLARSAGIGLLDSTLNAPQAGFGGHEMYPDFVDKAAVLAVRVARNHPLPDGNKRLAWGCLTMFCLLNGWEADREILRRVTRGDLQPEFQAALDADLTADPLLGGSENSDQVN